MVDNRLFGLVSQLNQGYRAGTNDRIREAVRGAQPFLGDGSAREMDFLRISMAGTLADYVLKDANDTAAKASAMSWNGQPAGYAGDPADIINYVSKHDNETLWDKLQYGLPADVMRADRVRIQNVAATIPLMSQGIPFLQMGGDMIRSKSMVVIPMTRVTGSTTSTSHSRRTTGMSAFQSPIRTRAHGRPSPNYLRTRRPR